MYAYLNDCTASGLTFLEVSQLRSNAIELTNYINIFTKYFKSKLIPPQDSLNF